MKTIIMTLSLLCLVGCKQDAEKAPERFQVVSRGTISACWYTVFKDTETGHEYMLISGTAVTQLK